MMHQCGWASFLEGVRLRRTMISRLHGFRTAAQLSFRLCQRSGWCPTVRRTGVAPVEDLHLPSPALQSATVTPRVRKRLLRDLNPHCLPPPLSHTPASPSTTKIHTCNFPAGVYHPLMTARKRTRERRDMTLPFGLYADVQQLLGGRGVSALVTTLLLRWKGEQAKKTRGKRGR